MRGSNALLRSHREVDRPMPAVDATGARGRDPAGTVRAAAAGSAVFVKRPAAAGGLDSQVFGVM
jgi:hypothetical protein